MKIDALAQGRHGTVRMLIAAIAVSGLAGCASLGTGAIEPVGAGTLIDPGTVTHPTSTVAGTLGASAVAALPPASEPTIVRGSDRMIAPPRARPAFTVDGGAVSLQFEQAPVAEVIHAIFGDVLALPYVINQSVTGTVTIRTVRPLERAQVLPVMESLLAANGLAVVQDSAGVFHIGTSESLRDVAPVLDLAGSLAPGQRVVIVPLQFISAAEMAEILAPVARPEALLRVDGMRNLLMLAGTGTQIEGWMEIVRVFDVDVLKGMSVGLFPLQHLSVKEAESALSLLITGAGGAPSPARPEGTGESFEAPQHQAGAAPRAGRIGPLGSVVRFIGIERLNAILVVTSRSYYLDQAREWIARFDKPYENIHEPRLFVYPVQNGTAGHLASLLSAVFGGTQAFVAAPAPATPGIAPGLPPAALGFVGPGGTGTSATRATPGTQPAGAAVTGIDIGADVRVVADEHNNAILIFASGRDFERIQAALRQLDRAPMQVLIEASIIEVTLNDELKYGLQWFFHGGLGGGRRGEGLLNLNAEGGIGPQQPGFSYTIRSPAGDVRAVLNALADKSLLKVISSPSVLVLDNHTAQIHVGDQQPVRSATTITEGGVQTTSIQFKDTGVQLAVTPSVNAGGMVSLDIMQTVTDVGGVDVATQQRTFLQRFISSKIATRSGETVVLGGLIRDNDVTGRQGVPVLHDIPVLGHLFGSTSNTRARTELLVMLTPRVLETEADLRGISEEMRRKMSRVNEMIGTLREQSEQSRHDGAGT